MVEIQNKRLMLSEGIECNFTPNLNDFMFFGGGGKGGGGTKIVYVPKVKTVKETVVAPNAPNAPKQEGASTITEDDKPSDDDEAIGGRNKTLGGTRKLTIPVTPSR